MPRGQPPPTFSPPRNGDRTVRRKPAAKPKDEPKGKPPVIKYQDGQVKISVWENEGDYGKMYSAVIKRVYKDGDEWRETDNIDFRDLLALALGLQTVHAEILALKGHGVTESPLNDDADGEGDGDDKSDAE